MTKAQEVQFLLNHQGRSPSRKRVAGYRPRPMAIEAVKGRLLRAADARTRWLLAMNLAETCYECFNVENLFRELIDRDPVDLDGILTALVELDLALSTSPRTGENSKSRWKRLFTESISRIRKHEELPSPEERRSAQPVVGGGDSSRAFDIDHASYVVLLWYEKGSH